MQKDKSFSYIYKHVNKQLSCAYQYYTVPEYSRKNVHANMMHKE